LSMYVQLVVLVSRVLAIHESQDYGGVICTETESEVYERFADAFTQLHPLTRFRALREQLLLDHLELG